MARVLTVLGLITVSQGVNELVVLALGGVVAGAMKKIGSGTAKRHSIADVQRLSGLAVAASGTR
jgi:hypothetical protein